MFFDIVFIVFFPYGYIVFKGENISKMGISQFLKSHFSETLNKLKSYVSDEKKRVCCNKAHQIQIRTSVDLLSGDIFDDPICALCKKSINVICGIPFCTECNKYYCFDCVSKNYPKKKCSCEHNLALSVISGNSIVLNTSTTNCQKCKEALKVSDPIWCCEFCNATFCQECYKRSM